MWGGGRVWSWGVCELCGVGSGVGVYVGYGVGMCGRNMGWGCAEGVGYEVGGMWWGRGK